MLRTKDAVDVISVHADLDSECDIVAELVESDKAGSVCVAVSTLVFEDRSDRNGASSSGDGKKGNDLELHFALGF
jgi:hypothetical protein